MKTLVTEKESQGNLEEILRVKPKVEIVYQAIKYTHYVLLWIIRINFYNVSISLG